MPKLKSEYPVEDDIEAEEELDELDEVEEVVNPKRFPPMPTKQQTMRTTPIPVKKETRGRPHKRRYEVISQTEGVIDTETNEMVVSNILDGFANIIERLERIENMIGQIG